MPKAQRHRKRVRTARLNASGLPLGSNKSQSSTTDSNEFGATDQTKPTKKQGRKEAEVTNLLDKLTSQDVQDRQWATSALANMFVTFPPVTQRLLLSKNLIGLLIERLTDTDDVVAVESLGSLRNLAVSSPTSIVSEMHNKRLLMPLINNHVPLLLSRFQQQVEGKPTLIDSPPLPSLAQDRKTVEEQNQKEQTRFKLFWDWSENVMTLFWCLSESTNKILSSLNLYADKLIEFAMLFLNERALGISGIVTNNESMSADATAKLNKKDKKPDTNERVPLFVAIAAAQLVHAFTAQNATAQTLLLQNPNLSSLTTILRSTNAPTTRSARTELHPSSDSTTDQEDWLQLRVLSFGILLELAKRPVNKRQTSTNDIRNVLKDNQSVLMKLLETDLINVADTSIEIHKTMDPKLAEQPGAATTGQAIKLNSIEKQLSTLQLSLEVLGEWCALMETDSLSNKNNSNDDMQDDVDDIEEEEEWAGIVEGDVEMDQDDDDVPADGIYRKQQPQYQEESIVDDITETDTTTEIELSSSTLNLFQKLPSLLLSFAHPTPLSFLQASTTAVSAPSNLISTDATTTTTQDEPRVVPEPLCAISDILTTIHVRSLECLNNLYITLARATLSTSTTTSTFFKHQQQQQELQNVWSGVLTLIQGAATSYTGSTINNEGELQKEDDMSELNQRRMEIVSAGVGSVWGMARIGISLVSSFDVGDSTSSFLISLFNHPFSRFTTPASETIRVRIIGTLGWTGRRSKISLKENEEIGSFLLSILPKDTSSRSNLTTEVLLQVIDSFIDIYSDEESIWDQPVFRSKEFLNKLESTVPGVRAAVRKVDRKRFPELRSRADGALENLLAFIHYRHQVA
ncbi:hypothetical protein OIO90_004903 [Microbotryomycetes sp. JL221]|nr:hypothetical protein OIO90_004903 [Microbotryomycetes sp. JL221]